jgi:hypothetical protein
VLGALQTPAILKLALFDQVVAAMGLALAVRVIAKAQPVAAPFDQRRSLLCADTADTRGIVVLDDGVYE